jgi:site-specific DNA-methyltransferase (adenine-specific)
MGDGYGGFGAPRRTGDVPLGRFPSNLYACKKPSTEERERGTAGLPEFSGAAMVRRAEGSAGTDNPRAGAGRKASGRRNIHPTVKPVRLFRWLCRLLTPPGGLVVDPFLGSGTTGIAAVLEGFDFAGCDLDGEGLYLPIARARIEHAIAYPEEWADTAPPRPTRDPGDTWGHPATQIALFGGGR